MARKKYTTEEIIGLLREAEVELANGQPMVAVLKKLAITANTYYRWRKEYGGLIRSDNGAEFTAKAVRAWLARVGVRTLFIEPGSPSENGYNERFNGTLRDELLNGEIFFTLPEAEVLIERWRREYNQVRPHSSLDYRPPAPEAW